MTSAMQTRLGALGVLGPDGEIPRAAAAGAATAASLYAIYMKEGGDRRTLRRPARGRTVEDRARASARLRSRVRPRSRLLGAAGRGGTHGDDLRPGAAGALCDAGCRRRERRVAPPPARPDTRARSGGVPRASGLRRGDSRRGRGRAPGAARLGGRRRADRDLRRTRTPTRSTRTSGACCRRCAARSRRRARASATSTS